MPRKLPPTTHILELVASGKTHAEIAKRYGVTYKAVDAAIYRHKNGRKGRDGVQLRELQNWNPDPRALFPYAAPFITDEAIEAWSNDHYCLCGCGIQTTVRVSGNKYGPAGSYSFWSIGHSTRFVVGGGGKGRARSEDFRARLRKRHAEGRWGVKSGMIIDLLNEWLIKNDMSLKRFAVANGFSSTNLSECRTHGRRLRRDTAARILVGIGEPLNDELHLAYKKWLSKAPQREASRALRDAA